jgi:hypothetical protein
MISLKTYIPTLAYVLNLTPAALYERQRVLVREGMLTGSAGYGPGSGVTATPSSVAWLIIAALATDSLSEIESGSVTKLASAKSSEGSCALTGAKDFKQALTSILRDDEMAERISSINVVRSVGKATVYYRKQGRQRIELSEFGPLTATATIYVLSVIASLPGDAIRWTARDLKFIAAGVKGSVFREELEATQKMRKASEADAERRTFERAKRNSNK